MTWPAVIFWVLILAGIASRGPLILYVGAIAGSFGTLQMLPGELVGGTNFLPGSVCAMSLVLKILVRQKPSALLRAAADPNRLGLLFAFYIWCLFSAFVMPRLFAGGVEVIPIVAQVPWPVPLQPTAANLTQPAYLTISIFSALAAYFATSHPAFIKHWLQASAVGGLVLIGTGLADLLLSTAGQSGLLEPFRNATYALLTDVEIVGSKRVVGLMPEASAYGGACVAAATGLAFLRPCFEPLWRDKIVPVAILGLIGMALLSTSSAAYAGLAIFGLVYSFNWARRRRSASAMVRSGLSTEAAVAIAAGLLFLVVLAFEPRILAPVYALLDQIIFQKSQSDSFEERNMWTRVGLEAFYGTYGLGVGFGAARTSNWFVAELSNTGVIGSFLLAVFIAKTLLCNTNAVSTKHSELIIGLKMDLIPGFVQGFLAGTSPDIPGTMNYGMILRLATLENERQSHSARTNGPPQIRSRYDTAA
jgi:hypothetical protein